MFKAQQIAGDVVEEYKVPEKLVGLVIGRGGKQLHRLQADTQCEVKIAPDANGAIDRNFTLVGTHAAIEHAKRSIDEILKRGSSLGIVMHHGDSETVKLNLAGNKCGLIIGKGGETIKRLSEQYGVKLVFVQDKNSAKGSDKQLHITGEPEKVAKAKAAILEMLNPIDEHQNANQEEAFVKVAGDKAGLVIGKGGESIKDINRRSGARVEIDRSHAQNGSEKMFVIRGDKEQIKYAEILIREKINGVHNITYGRTLLEYNQHNAEILACFKNYKPMTPEELLIPREPDDKLTKMFFDPKKGGWYYQN